MEFQLPPYGRTSDQSTKQQCKQLCYPAQNEQEQKVHFKKKANEVDEKSSNLAFRCRKDYDENVEDNESYGLVFSMTTSMDSPPRPQRWTKVRATDDDYLEDGDEEDFLSSEGGMYEGQEGHEGQEGFYFAGASPTISNRRLRWLGGIAVLVAVLALLLPRSKEKRHVDLSEPYASKKIKGTPQYVCPVFPDGTDGGTDELEGVKGMEGMEGVVKSGESSLVLSPSQNLNNYDIVTSQEAESRAAQVLQDLEAFLETFRNKQGFEPRWNVTLKGPASKAITYNLIKDDLRQWKKSKFLENLKTGDSIYQSGSGMGLDLALTLELLHEENDEHYVTDLHVYGNDHVFKSAQAANLLLDRLATQAGSKLGVVCAADSTSLSQFVPEESFDLVFASAIPSLFNPLHFHHDYHDTYTSNTNYTSDKSDTNYTSGNSLPIDNHNNNTTITTDHHFAEFVDELCQQGGPNATDWKVWTLWNIAQDRQNDWYRSWVTEMIRIAKPGAPIIVEFVGHPYCTNYTQTNNNRLRDGVAPTFWLDNSVEWNIDLHSIEFENDHLFPFTYHVFMRKNE